MVEVTKANEYTSKCVANLSNTKLGSKLVEAIRVAGLSRTSADSGPKT